MALVTPILTYGDMETLQELIRQLRHAGAKSDAGRGYFLRHLAECEAELDVALELPCVEAAPAPVARFVELEEPELDRAFGEGCVVIEHMVAAVVVVLVPAVACAVACVPDVRKGRRYCRTVDPRFLEQVNRKKPSTMAALADIWYTSHEKNFCFKTGIVWFTFCSINGTSL
mgnify:CR=1 FL=1